MSKFFNQIHHAHVRHMCSLIPLMLIADCFLARYMDANFGAVVNWYKALYTLRNTILVNNTLYTDFGSLPGLHVWQTWFL